MSDESPRLALPFLLPAQAQKHVTHNEALERLDLLTQLTVEGFDATTPPPGPEPGQIWALGAGASGAWAGHDGALAAWVGGDWQFIAPAPGWRAAQGSDLRLWTGSAWEAPGPANLDNLAGLGVNAIADASNRLAVSSPATLFNHEGAGHQLKINKAAPADTASLLFQTGFSGRAEMGTAGNDDFSIKVSPDGTTWHDGIVVDGVSGAVHAPSGLVVDGTLNLPAGSVTRAALASGTGLSLIGRNADSAGAVADMAAGTDHQVMRRSGSTLGFGAVALNQPAAVTGQLPVANGGTGASTAANARTNLGLGSAATADVTQSTTDTTPGRLLRVGDFGLGLDGSGTHVVGNIDEATTSGFFGVNTGTTGTRPAGSTNFAFLLVQRQATTSVSQLWTNSNGTEVFYRIGSGDPIVWVGWRRFWHSDNILGTVSQSGGTPTGAIIESGSNSNGEYVRFADGTQICWHELTTSDSSAVEWSYPAAFVTRPTGISVTSRASGAPRIGSTNGPGQNTFVFVNLFDISGARVEAAAGLIATGRWF